ncbi:MAG: beta-lactamase family protein [Butyrivibrio sp.]|nr:beta-lactamase family protein [Butyrivibrio sp.]
MNQKKLKLLDSILESQKESEKLLGASLRIEHKGKKVYENVIGTDRKDSIYKIFSMTAPVTAVAAMILYERGQLDLMRKVSDYLPSFKEMYVASPDGIHKAEKPITIHNLLNMTSGIVFPGDYGEAARSMTRVYREAKTQVGSGILKTDLEVFNKMAEGYLAFEPDNGFKFGLSADILGGVIEVITGQSLSEFYKKEIFTPLNMEDTAFYIDDANSLRQAVLYRRKKDGTLKRAEVDVKQRMEMEDPFRKPWYESGGYGLYSTVEDYTHFSKMLLNKGSYNGKEILGRKTFEFMTTNQLNDLQLSQLKLENYLGYGFGNYFRILMNPAAASSNGSKGEFGFDGAAGTYFLVDPTEELIIVYMQQIDTGCDYSFIRSLKQIIYGSI